MAMSTPKPVKQESEFAADTYAVEKIVGIRVIEGGEKLYKVRWKGFSESEDTWEPYRNLTGGCDRLIMEYQATMKGKDDENGEHSRPSTSRSNGTSEESTERSSGRNTVRWEYETVEVLTPDEWNRFGDVDNRELGGLYIPDRIPSMTEKILSNLPPDLGRVTRNRLKTVMRTESSPVKETSPSSSGRKGGVARGRGATRKASGSSTGSKKPSGDGRRSVIKDECKAMATSSTAEEQQKESSEQTSARVAVPTKAEIPDEVLLSQFSGGALQIAAADTSTESAEHSPIPQSSNEGRSASAKRGGRGKGSGASRSRSRGKSKKKSTSPRSNEDVVSSANPEVHATSAEASEESSNLVVDEGGAESTFDEETSSRSLEKVSPPASLQGKSRSRKATTAKSGNRATTPQEKTVEGAGETCGTDAKSDNGKEQKAPTSAENIAGEEISAGEGTSKRSEVPSTTDLSDEFVADEHPSGPETEVSALEMLLLETPELPIPTTTASIAEIELATIRKDQQNREKPLQTFEQFRSAALSNQFSAIRWTGRVVPERRGFDFNQKYRGKTVAIELCERPCGPAHEVDDMLRQIVRDGARLDIPDDTRGRIPLHFAISCEFWCRVKILLHLRSPVNTPDKDKKTPLHLLLLTSPRVQHFEVTRMIYLLLEYGADVNEVINKLAPLRNRFVPKLVEHQQRLTEVFDEARMKTLVDIAVKRVILPVTIRAMWEFEWADWTTEIGFNYEVSPLPNDRYGYMILLAVFDYRSARNWRVRMWGTCPFASIQMNDEEATPLTNPKGFVYVTTLINGWNRLKIKFEESVIKRKKLLLMAQVLLIQLHKPAQSAPKPALEVATESGTDWRHD